MDTNNSRAPMGSAPYSFYHCPGEPSTSMARLDPLGLHCTTSPSASPLFLYDSFTKKTGTLDTQRNPVLGYPSPPPTSSQPKRSVPLPSLTANGETACCVPHSRHFGGILDSPVVLKHEALGCHAPLSPPPTVPTPTHALPPTDDALPSISEQEDYEEPYLGLPSPSRSPVEEGDRLLSPLSSDWVPNQILSSDMPLSDPPDDCVLLHRNPSALSRTFDYIPDSFSHPPSSRPALSLLAIPDTPYHSASSWDEPPSPLMYEEDESALSTPLSPPHSPLLEKLSLEPADMFQDQFFNEEKHPFLLHPSPPPIHHIHLLPELEDAARTSPSSPSLRSFSDLPDLGADDDDDMDFLRSPSLSPASPRSSLLALPGADADDELLPAHLGPAGFVPADAHPVPATPPSNRSLLLLDDPNDVPPPRSPSPEHFHLDPALLAGCADPEVRRLYELRRRAQAAERAARLLETRTLEEEGAALVRWEARRTRRREKERCGEITAMLRLGLTAQGYLDELEPEPHHQQTKSSSSSSSGGGGGGSSVIRSMGHLVAKMLLRRGDTARSLANRKTPYHCAARRVQSPLARSSAGPDGEDDGDESSDMDVDGDLGDDDDDDEDAWPPVPWPMDPMDLEKDGYEIPR